MEEKITIFFLFSIDITVKLKYEYRKKVEVISFKNIDNIMKYQYNYQYIDLIQMLFIFSNVMKRVQYIDKFGNEYHWKFWLENVNFLIDINVLLFVIYSSSYLDNNFVFLFYKVSIMIIFEQN